jgi:hypothetical protein
LERSFAEPVLDARLDKIEDAFLLIHRTHRPPPVNGDILEEAEKDIPRAGYRHFTRLGVLNLRLTSHNKEFSTEAT